jgi:hypothetical protein
MIAWSAFSAGLAQPAVTPATASVTIASAIAGTRFMARLASLV